MWDAQPTASLQGLTPLVTRDTCAQPCPRSLTLPSPPHRPTTPPSPPTTAPHTFLRAAPSAWGALVDHLHTQIPPAAQKPHAGTGGGLCPPE